MQDKFFKLIKSVLLTIIFGLLLFIFVTRLLISIDFPTFEIHIRQARLYYFFDFITVIIIFVLMFLSKLKVTDKLTKILTLTIPLVIGLICLFVYKYEKGSDSLYCWHIANLLNETNDMTIVMNAMNNYLCMYPFQYGFISVFRVFDYFFNTEVSYRIFQVVIVSISNLVLYKLVFFKTVKNKERLNAWYLIVSIFWVIPWLLSPYAYGFGLGLSFAIFSVYYFNKYLTTQRFAYLLPCLIFSVVAIYVKMNYVILLLAYILLIIFILRDRIIKKMMLTLLVSTTMILSMNMVNISAKLINNLELPKGTPILAWFVMSSPIEQEEVGVLFNPYPTVGYYSGYNYGVASENNYDQEKMDIAVKEDFKYTIEYIKDNPAKSLKYYVLKIIDTWNSNDFLSRQYMVGEDNKDIDRPVVADINNGFTGFLIKTLTNVGSVLLLMGSLLYIIKNRKDSNAIYCLLFIWFIGGFLYHLLFETKAVYVYPYMTILMPIAAIGLNDFQDSFKRFTSEKKNKKYVYSFIPLVLLFAFVYNRQEFILPSFVSYADINNEVVVDNSVDLQQTITLNQDLSVDAIEFEYSGRLNDNILEISILENDNKLEVINITQSDLDKSPNWIQKKFDNVKLSKDKEYKIIFDNIGEGYSDFKMYYGPTSWDNDTVMVNDLEYKNSTINYKLLTKEYSRWYYYQNNKVQYVSDMYYN